MPMGYRVFLWAVAALVTLLAATIPADDGYVVVNLPGVK
jgi:hypothetical protein